MISVINPISNRYLKNSSLALILENRLHSYWTTFTWNSGNIFNKILPEVVLSEFKKRELDEALYPYIKTHPWHELIRQVLLRSPWYKHALEGGSFSPHTIYNELDRYAAKHIPFHETKMIHAHEDGALFVFNEAKKKGNLCLYELPVPYWKYKYDIISEEIRKFPEWRLSAKSLFVPDWLTSRKEEELKLADYVLVPSTFVKNSILQYHPQYEEKIQVLPYGAPPIKDNREKRQEKKERKTRILFAGSIEFRKGLPYLFQILEKLGDDFEITIVGKKTNPDLKAADSELKKFHYIPYLPHEELLNLMESHDIFLFPTIYEGQAQVITEAMSRGMVVLTTPFAGVGHFLSHQQEGFIYDHHDIQSFIDTLYLLKNKPDMLENMSRSATKSAGAHSWYDYRQKYLDFIEKISPSK